MKRRFYGLQHFSPFLQTQKKKNEFGQDSAYVC